MLLNVRIVHLRVFQRLALHFELLCGAPVTGLPPLLLVIPILELFFFLSRALCL